MLGLLPYPCTPMKPNGKTPRQCEYSNVLTQFPPFFASDGKCHLSPEEVGQLVSQLGPCMADVDEVTTDIVMPGEENVDSEDMEEGEEERFFGGFFCTNYCAGPCVSVKVLIARGGGCLN